MSATALMHPPASIDADRARACLPQVTETYVCPACDCQIRPEQIARKTDRAGIRITTAVCQDCSGIYRIRQLLEGGFWRTLGSVELVTSARDRAAALARIDEIQRTVRIDKL